MTHLSDFSFLGRAVVEVYIFIFLMYHVWSIDKFHCLHPRKIFSGELKSVVTLMMLVMMPCQAFYDFETTKIKYTVGFTQIEPGVIISTPYQLWPQNFKDFVPAMDYMESVTFSLQTGIFFLLQCFWSYLSNSVAKHSFMGSLEFKINILWCIISIALFPVLQWIYRNDELYSEIVPQLAYGIEALIIGLMGIRSHFRFRSLITKTHNVTNGKSIVTKLTYFMEMNVLMTLILIMYGTSFIILCVDGLTPAQTINHNKFATDLLISNVNVCTVFLWLLFIMVFHPRKLYAGPVSSHMESTRAGAPHETFGTNKFTSRVSNYVSYNAEQSKSRADSVHRPMTPVVVEYPTSLTTDTASLTRNTGHESIAISDPYTNSSLTFTMVSPTTKQYNTRLPGSPRQDFPMHSMQRNRYDSFDERVNSEKSDSRYESFAPSEAPPSMFEEAWIHDRSRGGDDVVNDWLRRSPDRKQPI